MSKLFLIIVVTFFTLKVECQLALINDSNGYCNVRESKRSNSKIVGKLYTDEIFVYNFDKDGEQWARVYYSKSDTNYVQGYLHSSRLLPLDQLKNVSRKQPYRTQTSDGLTIKNDSIKVVVMTSSFSSKKHKIERNSDGYVVKIDSRQPHGVDGNLPTAELKQISVELNNKQVYIPGSAYNDLFEPGIDSFNVYFDSKGTIFLYMPLNSDGAGGYFVAWMIRNGKYVKRYVDSP